jgi:hypothetical protein
MALAEQISQIMDSFDEIYSSPTTEERILATREALLLTVHQKEQPDSWGFHIKTNKLIDLLVPFMDSKQGVVDREELTRMFLAVLDTSPDEIESKVGQQIMVDRLIPQIDSSAKHFGLDNFRPSKERDRESKLPTHLYTKVIDGWELSLLYFPDYIYHHLIYGSYNVEPQIKQSLVLSLRRLEKIDYDNRFKGRLFKLDEFLKSREVDELARKYGVSYYIAGKFDRLTRHEGHGGYERMVKDLAEELTNTPYSADKLIKNVQCPIDIFREEDGLSFHLVAKDTWIKDSYDDKPESRRNLGLALGVDFLKVSRERWQEFKKLVPTALRALSYLQDFPTQS